MKPTKAFPKILLYRIPTDMRKQSASLALIVEQTLHESPFDEECLYVFANRKRDIVKALYFHRAGFCLWCKKLDEGKFPWPSKTKEDKVVVTARDLDLVFDGVDVFKRHKKLDFRSLT